MSNLRCILPLLLCLSLLCACVQMPNAPKDETPLQSPLPTATPESSAAPAPLRTSCRRGTRCSSAGRSPSTSTRRSP